MATNLRLRPEAEDALRRESQRTGRSQQELIREAIDRYLDVRLADANTKRPTLVERGLGLPPRSPMRAAVRLISLPDGITSLDLLDRNDRF